MKKYAVYVSLLIITVLSFWSFNALLHEGLYPMHDDTQVARVFTMVTSLRDGMFPVRWVSDLGYGYGYPIFNFYAPFAYYVGALFMLLGLSAIAATKLMIGTGIVFAGITMFFLAREIWGNKGGIIAALLYVYAPYHALNVYVRGDIAEVYAYAWIPLIFYALLKLAKKPQGHTIAFGAVGYAGVITSHNLTALMVTPFLLLFALLLWYRQDHRKELAQSFALLFLFGVGLSAYYWLPTLLEMRYTNVLSQIGGGADYKDHFVCLRQLWDSPWGFGGSTYGCIDGMSFRIGKIHILIAALSACLLFMQKKTTRYTKSIVLFSLSMFVGSVLIVLPMTKFVWDIVPLMAFFQFPWRFLGMASFFSSLLGGGIIVLFHYAQRRFHLPSVVTVIGFGMVFGAILLLYAKLFIPQEYVAKTNEAYTRRDILRWETSKISDEYLPKGFTEPESEAEVPTQKIVVKKGRGTLSITDERTTAVHAQVTALTPLQLHLNIAAFPAWQVFDNGKRISYHEAKNGMTISLAQGAHTLDVVFRQTAVQKLANIMTLVSIVVLFVGIMYKRILFYERKTT